MVKNQLGVILQPSNNDHSNRVGSAFTPKPRPVLVKFATYRARERVYKARSCLKKKNLSIFINEDLTRKQAKLAAAARRLKKDKKLLETWRHDGKVFVKNNADFPHIVYSMDKLEGPH